MAEKKSFVEIFAQQPFTGSHASAVRELTAADGPFPGEVGIVESVIRGLLSLGVEFQGLPAAQTERKPTCVECGKLVNIGNDCWRCQKLPPPARPDLPFATGPVDPSLLVVDGDEDGDEDGIPDEKLI